jgi:hypothetical protein
MEAVPVFFPLLVVLCVSASEEVKSSSTAAEHTLYEYVNYRCGTGVHHTHPYSQLTFALRTSTARLSGRVHIQV